MVSYASKKKSEIISEAEGREASYIDHPMELIARRLSNGQADQRGEAEGEGPRLTVAIVLLLGLSNNTPR